MPGDSKSYVHGASGTRLLGKTIGECLDDTVTRFGEQEALVSVHQGIRWTYRELQKQVDDYAAAFLAMGLEPGDRVGIWAHNCAEWLVTQLATAKAGMVLVNINPAYRRAELVYALNKVECSALVFMPAHAGSDYIAIMQQVAPELAECPAGALVCAEVPSLKQLVCLGEDKTPGMYNFSQLPGLVRDEHRRRVAELAGLLQVDDPINIQFTSGTTGQPKGATLSHHNILNNGYFVAEAQRFTEQDRLCVPVPLYHCFGMVMGNLGCITHGSTIVYPAASFDARATLEAVSQEGCTALYGVPTMFIAQLGHPEFGQFDLSSLRTGCMAGSTCPETIMRQVINDMHMRAVTIAYGMTETSPVSFQTASDDGMDERVATVGRVQPHLEVKVVDEAGRVVPRGETGELCTRGYAVMLGYWNDEEKTREVIDVARWMYTGDLGTIDERGYCRIVGRLKDMVVRGGENLYPREIEEYLFRHEAVQDVQVFGVPDEKYGEQLCAWISRKPGVDCDEESILGFCREQISHHKIPRHIRFVEEFPMTITGKVQKFRMREMMIEELGLAQARGCSG